MTRTRSKMNPQHEQRAEFLSVTGLARTLPTLAVRISKRAVTQHDKRRN